MPISKTRYATFDKVAFDQMSHDEKLKILSEFIRALDESIKGVQDPTTEPPVVKKGARKQS